MRHHILASVLLSVAMVVSGGCGGSADTSSPEAKAMSIDEYAKRSCAISADFTNRLQALQTEMQNNIGYPAILGDTIAKVADEYRDFAADIEKMGDPPNGEAVGEVKELAVDFNSLADKVERSASGLRAARNPDEINAAVMQFMATSDDARALMEKHESKYPTPELDKLTEKIPGCSSGEK